MAPFPKGHPLHVSSPEEDIAEITATTLDQVRQFHRDYFGALFADWKNPRPFSRLVRSAPAIDSATVVIETPDKANAFLVAAQNLVLRDDDPDYPALALANFMLGGGFLNSRLAVRLRQQEGISYFVGTQLQVASLDRAGTEFQIAIYNPQNVDRLVVGMWDELNK